MVPETHLTAYHRVAMLGNGHPMPLQTLPHLAARYFPHPLHLEHHTRLRSHCHHLIVSLCHISKIPQCLCVLADLAGQFLLAGLGPTSAASVMLYNLSNIYNIGF